MIDAVSEFLTENLQRRYPFAEDTGLLDDSEAYEIPNSLLIDYRGFHRARIESKPRLAAIVGSGAGADVAYPAAAGKFRLFFEMGPIASPLRMMAEIDETDVREIAELFASVADPHYPELSIGSLRVTIGNEWRSFIGSPDRWVFGASSAVLEPALTTETYRLQIDYLRLIHQDGPTEYLKGDVEIYGGQNMTVAENGKNTIYLSAEVGAGEFGRFVGRLRDPDLEYCDGALMFINGIGPNGRGELTIAAGNGIDVLPLPDEHKIRISVSPPTLQRPLCAP